VFSQINQSSIKTAQGAGNAQEHNHNRCTRGRKRPKINFSQINQSINHNNEPNLINGYSPIRHTTQ